MTTSPLDKHAYFSSQARPSVIIFTSLPPLSGFTKIVSSASPRFRFSIAEAGVIRSLPSLRPALCLEVRRQFGTGALHIRFALESKLLNKRLVIDVGRVFRKRQVLDVEFILSPAWARLFRLAQSLARLLPVCPLRLSSGSFESAT